MAQVLQLSKVHVLSPVIDFWFCDPDVTWSVDMGEFGLRIWIFHVAGAAFHILTLQG